MAEHTPHPGSDSGTGPGSDAPSGGASDPRPFAIESARFLSDRKCTDVELLDVRGLSEVTDFVLVGTGTSDRQMKSVADEIKKWGEAQGEIAFARDRDPATTWIVVDFVSLIVHLFEPNQRAYYDLESMWSDAPRVSWARPENGAAAGG